MINTIKKIFSRFNNNNVVHLGRWAIKHETDHCNRYMQHLHADPGYPLGKNYSYREKINIEINNKNIKESKDN